MTGLTCPHATWLKKSSTSLKTSDGINVEVFELGVEHNDTATLSQWARQFREHYCLDSQIDRLRQGTGKSRAAYLLDLVFPDATDDFGPATRSGDFAEILIADLLQSYFGFWTPRVRYDDKLMRNESAKGSDILGFQVHGTKPSKNDTLIACESKAQLSGGKAKPRLQDAVDDSAKDVLRLAESLNALKRRLLARQDEDAALRVERFQDGLDRPYTRQSAAAAVFCSGIYNASHVAATTKGAGHENAANLMLIVVHSATLMQFVHSLYQRAANEA